MAFEEAKEYGENYLRDLTVAVCKVEEKHKNFVRMAIQALEEIQQYRAIGTVEELQVLNRIAEETAEYVKEDKKILETYQRIGTIEEFKALKEKNEPKKIEKRGYVFVCPICKKWLQSSQENCHGCGQALDWQ